MEEERIEDALQQIVDHVRQIYPGYTWKEAWGPWGPFDAIHLSVAAKDASGKLSQAAKRPWADIRDSIDLSGIAEAMAVEALQTLPGGKAGQTQ